MRYVEARKPAPSAFDLRIDAPAFTLESVPRNLHPRAVKTMPGERLLIERIRRRAGASVSNRVRLGIGDDCAILKPPSGHELLITTDFSMEGVHFRRDWHSPASAGHRTLARGLSDIAAMGGKPMAAFLSLALPRPAARETTGATETTWLDGFLDGLLALAGEHKIALAGGDTSESPSEHILADIVLVGSAPSGRALRRSAARAGDLLYCSGSLGGAAAELAELSVAPRKFDGADPAADHPHLFPQPRLAAGAALLSRRLRSACIDLSDGLSTDLSHLCAASGVRAEVDAASLPLHPLAQMRGADAALEMALNGGEDYELLFTAPEAARLPHSLGGTRVTKIGRILGTERRGPQVTLVGVDGRRSALPPQGWEHLR